MRMLRRYDASSTSSVSPEGGENEGEGPTPSNNEEVEKKEVEVDVKMGDRGKYSVVDTPSKPAASVRTNTIRAVGSDSKLMFKNVKVSFIAVAIYSSIWGCRVGLSLTEWYLPEKGVSVKPMDLSWLVEGR